MTTIAEYISKVGVAVDMSQLSKVDRYLALIDRKMKRFSQGNRAFGFDISRFTIDQTKLNIALGNALDRASRQVPFEISKFVVNDRALLAALLRAARRLPHVPPGGGPHPPYPPGPRPPYPPYPPGPGNRRDTAPRISSRGIFSGGGMGLYGPALALAGGGYGLAQLNQTNQRVVSAQLQSQSVVQQAGGTVAQGDQSFAWLRQQGNRIGFNYLDAAPDYNKLLSGLTGAGMSVAQGQDVFKGFSELSRVNKLDKTTQSRLFRALSQVAGKDQLMSEELDF